MKTPETQHAKIINHLLTGATLTPLEAIYLIGTTKLATRCSELISMGFNIQKKMINVKTRFGSKHVMQYSLSPTPKEKKLYNEMLFI